VISQKALDSITLIMFLIILLAIPIGLVQVILGGSLFSNVSAWMLRAVEIIFGITIVLMIVVLVLENEDPVHTLAWILVLLYIPVVGFFIYLFFGRNWRKSRLFSRKELQDSFRFEDVAGNFFKPDGRENFSPLQRRISKLLDNNSKAILTYRNEVDILADTNDALDLICEEIAKARRYVHLEYFSIARDSTGKRLKELLIRKASEGVEIRFIYDDVGCWNLGPRFKAELRKAGVQFVPFMPVWIPFLNSRLNYRNHRKLVIVDGSIGFLGGLNIGDKYMGKSKYFGYWRDSQVKLRGESVMALQAIFLMDWFFVSKQNLLTRESFANFAQLPEPSSQEELYKPVQITASGPDTDHASIMQAYFCAISNARRSIRITTPYLILNGSLLMAFKTAALSGVKIQIILPGKADHFIVFWGSRSYYRELLELGVEIYEYQAGFIHAKVLIVDDELLSTGTANMDLRSFNHNFEVAAMIYDKSITAQALEHFAEDMSKSRKVVLDEFQRRSIFKKGVESLCRLFSPLL